METGIPGFLFEGIAEIEEKKNDAGDTVVPLEPKEVLEGQHEAVNFNGKP